MILCTEGAIVADRMIDIAGRRTEGQVLPFSFETQQSIQSLHTIKS